ncbi:hypothetical protein RclHR1_17990003 [Rhizophagus clarus]|uniref:Uncharacterized protein n=1 Tax=Rhizophagus clarus TaxID=94130 RepID=A0A2Z6R1M2_9GLOM|nr:hypothetical protein RclHR1_17990003 [Rhizophagus clarus]
MQPWTSFQRSRTPLKTDYNISKVWNSLEADQVQSSLEADQYFEGLKFRGGPEFRKSRTQSRLKIKKTLIFVLINIKLAFIFLGLKEVDQIILKTSISKVQNSLEADRYIEEANQDFEGSELEVNQRSERSRPSQVISKNSNSKRTSILKVWNSLLKQTMIFEDLDLSFIEDHDIQRFRLSFTADHKVDQNISKSGSSNSKQIRLEPHFETDQICGFQIPSGLNFEDSWISESFLKHNFEVRSDSIFEVCHFIGSKKLKVVC